MLITYCRSHQTKVRDRNSEERWKGENTTRKMVANIFKYVFIIIETFFSINFFLFLLIKSGLLIFL